MNGPYGDDEALANQRRMLAKIWRSPSTGQAHEIGFDVADLLACSAVTGAARAGSPHKGTL